MQRRAVTVAARIATTQLVCSRWALESYAQVMRKEHGGVPPEHHERLTDGIQQVERAFSWRSLPSTTWEREWMQQTALSWSPDQLASLECYWESLGTLLWSVHVIPTMPKPWQEFQREPMYPLTGIVPSRPTSVDYWIRSFEKEEEEDRTVVDKNNQQPLQQLGLRSMEERVQERYRALFWLWRSHVHPLDTLTAQQQTELLEAQPKLRPLLRHLKKGIEGVTMLGKGRHLLPETVETDFGVEATLDGGEEVAVRAYGELDARSNTIVQRISSGRSLALRWLCLNEGVSMDTSWNLEEVQGAQALATSVSTIWAAEEASAAVDHQAEMK